MTRLKRSLLALLCTGVAAAVPLRAAAAEQAYQDVPVPGGTAALGRALSIDPVPERARFVAEVTRLAYDLEGRNPSTAAFLQAVRLKARGGEDKRRSRTPGDGETAASELVPVPLRPEIWNDAIFHRRVALDDLVTTIVADRHAALLCHGLTALDDETLEFFAAHTSLLSRLYERSAPVFAVFSASVHVRGNRIVPAGADARVPAGERPARDRDQVSALWEAVVGEKVTRPERFIISLFEAGEGRLAYLFDTVGHLDPARRRFTLGLWIDDPVRRVDRFKALATAGLGAFKEWHVRTMPYSRAPWDFAMAVMRLEVNENGAPAPPASRAIWSRALASTDVFEEAVLPAKGADALIDAAWLAEAVGEADIRLRVDRLDQIALAQRRFAALAPEDVPSAVAAVRGLPHYRMLLLTLDRIGVQATPLYAAAVRQAQRLASLPGSRAFAAQAQFQGALAIVARMAAVRSVTLRQAEFLIQRLAGVPITDEGRFAGGIVRWLHDDLLPAVAAGSAATLEDAIVAAVAGPPSADGTSARIIWEGQPYRLDLGFAERRRLHRVRERQEAVPIDVPVQIATLARRLGSDTPADVSAAIGQLSTMLETVLKRFRPDAGGSAAAHEIVRKTADELGRLGRSRDVKREMRVAETLTELGDELLGHVLLSFAYAMHLGDPDGAALLAGDVSYRHDFGLSVKDGPMRSRTAWTMPRQEVAPGVPWHVSGSLAALDLGLATLALRRVNFEHLAGAPRLTSNERDAFAASVALMNPYDLRDEDRDAIVAAAARGRSRVLSLPGNRASIDAVAAAIEADARRRRELEWTVAHDQDAVVSMFSTTELLVLGGADLRALDAWGMVGLTSAGCLCSRLPPPGRWWLLAGRPQLGIIATGIADLNLHVAAALKELQLPAALARIVLSGAMQDFIDEVRPTDEGDWLTLARRSRTATREQIEDYLAAATADGPLVPDVRTSSRH